MRYQPIKLIFMIFKLNDQVMIPGHIHSFFGFSRFFENRTVPIIPILTGSFVF